MQTCPECGKTFDPADRATPLTQEASAIQIIYCSVACKRKAGNRRSYQRNKEKRIAAVLKRRKMTKRTVSVAP